MSEPESADLVGRTWWSDFQRSRPGIAGLVFLGAMLILCLGTLPWSLGVVATPLPDGSVGYVPRFDNQNRQGRHLPPWWWPHDAHERERLDEVTSARALSRRTAGGSPPRFWLGTDVLGRDMLARCLAGGGISLGIGLCAAVLSVGIGTVYGSIAGYFGGRLDSAMMRFVDILYGLPYILLVVLLAVAADARLDAWQASHGELSGAAQQVIGIATLLVALSSVSWLTMARVVRGQVLSLKARPFMEAARSIGVPVHVQLRRHLLPNLVGPVVVYATLTVPQVILQESFLSFLGIGVRPPLPSWGNLAADGLVELNPYDSKWWLLLIPCVMLGGTLLALNFVGEGLREAVDPRGARR